MFLGIEYSIVVDGLNGFGKFWWSAKLVGSPGDSFTPVANDDSEFNQMAFADAVVSNPFEAQPVKTYRLNG